jgi:hypothetical protein
MGTASRGVIGVLDRESRRVRRKSCVWGGGDKKSNNKGGWVRVGGGPDKDSVHGCMRPNWRLLIEAT